MHTDPVCGMAVDPATTTHHARHDGSDYPFCSDGCRRKFIADPQRYLTPDAATFIVANDDNYGAEYKLAA